MDTVTGVLVDVSGSMQKSIGKTQRYKGESWARSIFAVVDDLIKYDVSPSNYVFALGFGAQRHPETFDLLNTIQNARVPSVSIYKSHQRILEDILNILERNGAPRVRTWAKMDNLRSIVNEADAKLFLDKLSNDERFRSRFIYECLPKSCRYFERSPGSFVAETGYWLSGFVPVASLQERATKGSVSEVVEKGKDLLWEVNSVSISINAVMSVHRAQRILHGSIGQEDLTDERVDELMKMVEPYIYGSTPLMTTLDAAAGLFAMPKFKDYTKLLFILSDGIPTDGKTPPLTSLRSLDVKTVCCYITDYFIRDPKRLYSTKQQYWNSAAELMFEMSSTIKTQFIPGSIFVNREWTIDTYNNETRLFVQVNHPKIIADACDLAKKVVCTQEALSEVLTHVSLDVYINQANQGFQPKQQQGNTCYANASAAVLHMSMLRIVGREGGYPGFFQLRDELIEKYGEAGANSLTVLQQICPKYRLQCNKVGVDGALKAVTEKRPVLARFRLTDAEWDRFSEFYERKPKGTLTLSELDIKRRRGPTVSSGHAVVLIGFSSRGLRLMNSWGSNWADGGFFTVSTADVLGLKFVDVFWTTQDLKQSEIAAYNTYGASIAQTLILRLKGLQTAQYQCPMCRRYSGVIEFSGNCLETTCPKCAGSFEVKEAGDDLALNLYLLSLSAPH